MEDLIYLSPEKRKKMPKEDPDQFWLNAEELPGEGNVYGGIILLPDGRNASIYLEMGKDTIRTLEATIVNIHRSTSSDMEKAEIYYTDIMLEDVDLQEIVMMGTREVTLQRYIFEEIIPYFYNRRKQGKVL